MAKSEWTMETEMMELLPYSAHVYSHKGMLAIISLENDLWHMSLSRRDRDPTYYEIKKARYDLLPNSITVAQIFPPEDEFVNVHEHCFHLFQLKPEEIASIKPFSQSLQES